MTKQKTRVSFLTNLNSSSSDESDLEEEEEKGWIETKPQNERNFGGPKLLSPPNYVLSSATKSKLVDDLNTNHESVLTFEELKQIEDDWGRRDPVNIALVFLSIMGYYGFLEFEDYIKSENSPLSNFCATNLSIRNRRDVNNVKSRKCENRTYVVSDKAEFASFQHWYTFYYSNDTPQGFDYMNALHRQGIARPLLNELTTEQRQRLQKEGFLLNPPLFQPPMFFLMKAYLDVYLQEPVAFINVLTNLWGKLEVLRYAEDMDSVKPCKPDLISEKLSTLAEPNVINGSENEGSSVCAEQAPVSIGWSSLYHLISRVMRSNTLHLFSDPQHEGELVDDEDIETLVDDLVQAGLVPENETGENQDMTQEKMAKVRAELKKQNARPRFNHKDVKPGVKVENLKPGVTVGGSKEARSKTTCVKRWFATKPESCVILPQVCNPRLVLVIVDDVDQPQTKRDTSITTKTKSNSKFYSQQYNQKEAHGWRAHGKEPSTPDAQKKSNVNADSNHEVDWLSRDPVQKSPDHFFVAEQLVSLVVAVWWCMNIDLVVAQEGRNWVENIVNVASTQTSYSSLRDKSLNTCSLMVEFKKKRVPMLFQTWLRMIETIRKYRNMAEYKLNKLL